MATFTHKSIEIELHDSGKFVATVGGKRVVKSSLVGMRKHIDDAEKNAFVPFKAIVKARHSLSNHATVIKGTEDYVVASIVSVEKDASTRRGRPPKVLFGVQTNWGIDGFPDVYKNDPKTIEAIKALEAHREKEKKIRDELADEEDRLRTELDAFKIDPEAFKAS